MFTGTATSVSRGRNPSGGSAIEMRRSRPVSTRFAGARSGGGTAPIVNMTTRALARPACPRCTTTGRSGIARGTAASSGASSRGAWSCGFRTDVRWGSCGSRYGCASRARKTSGRARSSVRRVTNVRRGARSGAALPARATTARAGNVSDSGAARCSIANASSTTPRAPAARLAPPSTTCCTKRRTGTSPSTCGVVPARAGSGPTSGPLALHRGRRFRQQCP